MISGWPTICLRSIFLNLLIPASIIRPGAIVRMGPATAYIPLLQSLILLACGRWILQGKRYELTNHSMPTVKHVYFG